MKHLLILLLLTVGTSTLTNAQTGEVLDTDYYTEVPTMPVFGNEGSKDMLRYFANNSKLKITESRTKNTVPVFANVIIEKDGSITFNGIARGEGKKRIKEVKRLISEMPKWSIGRLNDGTPARVGYIVPFWFVGK